MIFEYNPNNVDFKSYKCEAKSVSFADGKDVAAKELEEIMKGYPTSVGVRAGLNGTDYRDNKVTVFIYYS